jgi:hypothetical protein
VNRIATIALFASLVAARIASAMPVLFHDGVPVETPLLGSMMSVNRLIWEPLDQALVVKVCSHAHPPTDGRTCASPRFYRIPGAFIQRGQLFVRNPHGLSGLVGGPGDHDTATPPNIRIDLAPSAHLNLRPDGVTLVTEIAP